MEEKREHNGDQGFTKRANGAIIPKNDISIFILSQIDELSAMIQKILVRLDLNNNVKLRLRDLYFTINRLMNDISRNNDLEYLNECVDIYDKYITDVLLEVKLKGFVLFKTEISVELNLLRAKFRILETISTIDAVKDQMNYLKWINRVSLYIFYLAVSVN